MADDGEPCTSGKESMDRISGSGVFGRSPDALVILTKHEQEDVYTVETTLRNLKSLEPFCVEWCYPLMVRNEDMDPRKLKKPGAFKEQFSPAQLMTALGNAELTTAEWETEACSLYKMSKRTFATKKKLLVDNNKSVVLTANGKWKATAPLGYTETKERDRLKENQLQTATTAIAPLQQDSSAVNATAAAAVILTAAAVHAPTNLPF